MLLALPRAAFAQQESFGATLQSTETCAVRNADFGSELPCRGVFVAPWVGANGEIVLLARTSQRTLVCDPLEIPHGASRLEASDSLWELLAREDPVGRVPYLKAI
jgi:hypothetical protein